MKPNIRNQVIWACATIVGLIGWFLILYMITQIYFWFNPSPEPFWFFTIFNQGGE